MLKDNKRITHQDYTLHILGKCGLGGKCTHLSGNSNIHIQYQTKTGINGSILHAKTTDDAVNLGK